MASCEDVGCQFGGDFDQSIIGVVTFLATLIDSWGYLIRFFIFETPSKLNI